MDLNLQVVPSAADALTASYSCPCGCHPGIDYHRGDPTAVEGCCCGNVFAVGVPGAADVDVPAGFARRSEVVETPWGERLDAVWAIGPSTHPDEHRSTSGAAGHDGHEPDGVDAGSALDPVCGMTVDRDVAVAKELTVDHAGRTYYFCARGCKLDFTDDPERYLDSSYRPSMA